MRAPVYYMTRIRPKVKLQELRDTLSFPSDPRRQVTPPLSWCISFRALIFLPNLLNRLGVVRREGIAKKFARERLHTARLFASLYSCCVIYFLGSNLDFFPR